VGHLRRCAVFSPSPIFLICLGCCAPRALHLAILATFFNDLLIASNSRFLILPEWRYPNVGSKVLSLCRQRIAGDWQAYFGQPLFLLETFVDPSRFHGTVYRAANWTCLGLSRGYRHTRDGYSSEAASPKLVFILPLQCNARVQLSHSTINPIYRTGAPRSC